MVWDRKGQAAGGEARLGWAGGPTGLAAYSERGGIAGGFDVFSGFLRAWALFVKFFSSAAPQILRAWLSISLLRAG